uniref:Dipeptidylpeptidase IV N-terminal domain-containing protein n=1 Tax=Timema cristinae TaxID=61476 RepID=A0A7R9CRI6_TIMCR|nr:unnamed protein product [Timema cristinae]
MSDIGVTSVFATNTSVRHFERSPVSRVTTPTNTPIVVNDAAYLENSKLFCDSSQLTADCFEKLPDQIISTAEDGEIEVRISELVAKGSRRRWKVIAGVAGVVALVIVVVVLLVVFLTKDDESPDSIPQTSSGRGPSLEDVLDRKYTAKDFNGTLLAVVSAPDYGLGGPGLDSRLITWVIFPKGEITQWSLGESNALQTSISTVDPKNHQLVVWAPQGNGYVYVHGNNIVYRSSAADILDKVITSTGVVGLIYHGIPDWVYEVKFVSEEVFSSNKALWFSPNGEWLAFASFNDTVARVMNIPYYGPPGNLEFQYTRAIPLRYPKVGDSTTFNSLKVEISKIAGCIVNHMTKCRSVRILVKDTYAVFLSPAQGLGYHGYEGYQPCTVLAVLKISEPSGWIDLFTPPKFSQDGSRLVLIHPQDQGSGLGSYRHVTLVDRSSNTPVSLTSGQFVVTQIHSWDYEQGLIDTLSYSSDEDIVVADMMLEPEKKKWVHDINKKRKVFGEVLYTV